MGPAVPRDESAAGFTCWLHLGLSAVLAAAAFALPGYHMVLWGTLGVTSSVAVVAGTVRNRPAQWLPWILVATALATFVAGDILYDVLTDVLHSTDPFPSVADGLYLATYPLFSAGLVLFVRARAHGQTSGPLLDALIVTTACALLSWIYLIQPYVRADGMPVFDKVVSVAYPLGDIAILCMLARLLAGGGRRNISLSLLTLGAGGLLAADVAYGAIQLNGTWKVGGPTDIGWVLFYACWGAAALHPSMRELTERQPLKESHLSRATLVTLTATTLVAPALLLWRSVTGDGGRDTAIVGAAAGLLCSLVMARLTGMARLQAAQATRERVLRATGESLVGATGMGAIDKAALSALRMVFGEEADAYLLTVPDGDRETVVSGHPALVGAGVAANGDGVLRAVRTDGGLGGPVIDAELHWTAVDVIGQHGPRRRIWIGHDGALPMWSANALDALAAQLALASDRVELSRELQRQEIEARFRSLVRNASDVILVVHDGGVLRSETPSIEAVLGYSELAAASLTLGRLVHCDDIAPAMALIDGMLAGVRSGPVTTRWRVRRADGEFVDMDVVANDLSGDIHVGGIVLTLRDVSERSALEDQLRHQAFHDSLTGLANRVLLSDRITHALERRARSAAGVAVLLIDVDDFKYVNDTLGHAAGDALLVSVSHRILTCLRDGDTAARLGGDEFAVCVEYDGEDSLVSSLAQRILDAVLAPCQVGGNEVTVGLSLGISTAGNRSDGAAEMLREADLALYAAKSSGKNGYCFFEPRLHQAAVDRIERRASLEEAIERGELRLHFQPILRLDDAQIVGFEALVRWEHPARGLIGPSEFIPTAEESGLVMPLGRWVLDQAVSEVARWQELKPDGSEPLHVAVNVSPRQLGSDDFLEVVGETLSRHGVEAAALTLEITESLLMQDSREVIDRLTSLKELGVTIALDDFGTGYSSLSYLHTLPIQILKIDRSFISGIGKHLERTSILRAIVALATALGLKVVAEGVEDEAQARQLDALRCGFGQGYHLGRPAPADVTHALLQSRLVGPGATPDRAGPGGGGLATLNRPGDAGGVVPEPVAWYPKSPSFNIRHDPRAIDLERLRQSHPMMDAVIDEVRGRRIRVDGRVLADFASCNYLGFDVDPEIIESVPASLRRWGTHPSWSRMLGSPRLYNEIEEQLTELLGAPDTLVLPTITHIHMSVIPALVGADWVFVDAQAHKTIYDGATVAAGRGATFRRFPSGDVVALERALSEAPAGARRVVCMDGVNSMTGNVPDLSAFAAVSRRHDAILYVDDAHGFGVIGEPDPAGVAPYGLRGNSIVRRCGETYDNVVLVGGFSKAYSSLLAFLALPTWLKNHLKVAVAPYLYSGPSPTASLATVLAGFSVNASRGEAIRADLHRKTARVLDTVHRLGLRTPNRSGLPIIELPLERPDDIDAVGRFLFDRGIYVTLAAYPLVPRDQVGFRVQVTAANGDDEIEELCAVLGELAERFAMQAAAVP